jgi:integrase
MARYTRREFQIGDYWLDQRDGSPAWYRCWIEGARTKRVSLNTADLEEAKAALKQYFILQHTKVLEEPASTPLADILKRYQAEHGDKVVSSSSSAVAVGYWLDHFNGANVDLLSDVTKQEEFHRFLRGKDLKESSILRVINTGKAALNRAYKRGELKHVPYILTVKPGAAEPMGRPMDVAELRRLYKAAAPHLKVFIGWMLGTAARTEAITSLLAEQVEREDKLINLNPAGRAQTKKYRPTVRLIPALASCSFRGNLIVEKSKPVHDVKSAWRTARAAADLDDKVNPYSLRHTAARWMRREGVSEWDTATQLGHRRPGVTERYTAYDPAYLKGAGEALDKLVNAVVDEWPVWGEGTAWRSGNPVQRVGWYSKLPDGFTGA